MRKENKKLIAQIERQVFFINELFELMHVGAIS